MKFILAGRSEDAQLRAMMRNDPMPGHVQIAYEREPDFFHGLDIQGPFHQVVAAMEDGNLLGFGCRSVRPLFINGEERDFGYLSSLRSSLQGKRRLGLSRAFRLFKDLHADGRCTGYITTIIEGNREALHTIASGRAGLPHYLDLGRCETHAIPVRRRNGIQPTGHIQVRSAQKGEEDLVIALLHQWGPGSQFFPALRKEDFGTALLRNLNVTDFLIAEQDHQPCGIAAVWDQSAFKQHRIQAYSPMLKVTRPFLNLGLRLRGHHPLPSAGGILRQAALCFRAACEPDPAITTAFVQSAACRLQRQNIPWLILGFHESDPARGAMKNVFSHRYLSRMFFVGWEPEREIYRQLDSRPIHFEPAVL